MLADLLNEKTVEIGVEATDWEDAIRKGAQPLLRNGSIEPRYVDAMIDAVKKLGPYIAIAPGIAIAHARPEEGVKKMGVSLITLRTPVCVGHSETVPITRLITLAAVDHEAHIHGLSALAAFLSDSDRFERLVGAQSVSEALGYVRDYSMSESGRR